MKQTATLTRVADTALDTAMLRQSAANASARRIVFQTGGRKHGSITRLVSPSDVGRMIKPFVFLDHAEVANG